MFVHIALSTGWTLEYVRWHLDLPTLADLSKYWRKYPPLQVMIAAYLGIKSDEPDAVDHKPSFEELMSQFPPVPYSLPHLHREHHE